MKYVYFLADDNEKAMNELIESNIKETERLWQDRPNSLPDLEKAYLHFIDKFHDEDKTDAFLGLREAVSAFDPSKNGISSFRAYAFRIMKGRVLDGKRSDGQISHYSIAKARKNAIQREYEYKTTGVVTTEKECTLKYLSVDEETIGPSGDGVTLLNQIYASPEEIEMSSLINDMPQEHQTICGLVLNGDSYEGIQHKTGLTYEQIAYILVDIQCFLSKEKIDNRIMSQYRNRSFALIKSILPKSTSSIQKNRDKANELMKLKIFNSFSKKEQDIIYAISAGISLTDIAINQKIPYFSIMKKWTFISNCSNEQGQKEYIDAKNRKIRASQNRRNEVLKHMDKMRKKSAQARWQKYMPTYKEMKNDLQEGLTYKEIGKKYDRCEDNISKIVKQYNLGHIRKKRPMSKEGKESRKLAMEAIKQDRRPSREIFEQDIQKMSWEQMIEKYGIDKSTLLRYAKNIGILHLKCETRHGIRSTSFLPQPTSIEEIIVQNRKPSYKDIYKRLLWNADFIAYEFGMSRRNILRCIAKHGLTKIREEFRK